uniref:Pentatricopeptide repeat-containing protein n=1 Tax=Brassica campestris TaxID=3711 RepID=M4E053_BRACM
MVEVDFFFQNAKIDGIITELRVTSARYKNKQLHSLVIKRGFSGNTFVNNGLINMYSKCGDVDGSLSVFRRMSERNYVSWNSMIASFARHGHRLAALKLYKEMISQDVNPIDVTFFFYHCSMLVSHVKLINKGQELLKTMQARA